MASANLEIIISAVDKTSGTVSGIASGLGKLGKVGLGVAAAGIGATVAGAGALGAGLVMLGKDAARLQPIEDAFNNIAKASGTSGKAMLTAFQEQGKGLVTNTDAMMAYNKAASLVGVEFANTLPEAMSYLSKVSASTGDDMGYLMQSLVTGVGRLSPMILDNLGIQVNLTEANEAYAASVGKSATELTKAEQQTAMMNMVMEKLGQTTAELPELNDPFKQFAVTMTNVKDQVTKSIGGAVIPSMSLLAEKLASFAEDPRFIEFLQKASAWLAENLPVAIEFAMNAIEKLIPVLAQIYTWLATNIPPAIQALAGFWKNTLKPALDTVYNFIVNSVIPAMKQIRDWMQTNLPPVIQALARIFGQAGGEVSRVAEFVKGVIQTLKNAWERDFLGIRTIVTTVINAIKGIIDAFTAAAQGDWYRFGEILRETAIAFMLGIATAIGKAITDIYNFFVKLGTDVVNYLKGIDWKQLGIDIILGIVNGVNTGLKWMTDAIAKLANAIVQTIKGILGIKSPSAVFYDVGRNITNGLGKGIKDGFPAVVSLMQSGLESLIHGVGYSTEKSSSIGSALAAVAGSGAANNLSAPSRRIPRGEEFARWLQSGGTRGRLPANIKAAAMEGRGRYAAQIRQILGLDTAGVFADIPSPQSAPTYANPEPLGIWERASAGGRAEPAININGDIYFTSEDNLISILRPVFRALYRETVKE